MVESKCSCSKVKKGPKPNSNRYKGMENLLRRIAYNLGNTPSKTEVKVISCVPIDVTDLQQKIISLEKQLEKSRCRRSSADCKAKVADCKAKVADCKAKITAPLVVNRAGTESTHPDQSTRQSKLAETPEYYPRRNKHKTPDLSLYLQDQEQYKVKKSLPRHAPARDNPRNVFGRVIPDAERTRFVYYAQTAGSPFTDYKKVDDTSKEKSDEAMDREYLSSLVERQHLVRMYMDDDMLGSQGSVPVCRDVPRCSGTSDDLCSCCHGNFLDVDCKIRKRPIYNPNIDGGNIYYDSSLYDVSPVKEKHKCSPEMNFAFLPEYYRFKPEYYLNMDSNSHNHTRSKPIQKRERRAKAVFLPDDSSATDGLVEFSHVYTKRLSPNHELRYSTDKSMLRNAECNARSENTEYQFGSSKPIRDLSAKLIPTSSHNNPSRLPSANAEQAQKTNNVQCSTAHVKALQTSVSNLGSMHNNIKVTLRNAACLALPLNEIECQTDPLNNPQLDFHSPPASDKTESTLNQIKTMLETVLVEVKTNSGMRTIVSEKDTKDATVQNEHTPSSECERLLNSYTYSPYAMLNPYMASCSRALPSYCSSMMRQTLTLPRVEVPPTDLNCLQNFPEMVHQTVAAHSCFPDKLNMMQPKQTSTCGTNTFHDPPKRRNTETEDLIKEIYKSIKLDVDYPVKTSPRDGINDTKAINISKAAPETVKTTLGREEIVFRGDVGTSRAARMGSPSSHSSLTRPHRRGGSFHQQPKATTSAQRRQFSCKGTNKDSHASDSDSASDVSDVGQPSASPAKGPLKTKKGFFGKVMSSVVNKMRKKEDKQPQKVEKRTNAITQDSESSDFETPIAPRERPVKHVSYAPAEPQPWRIEETRPIITSSRTRRLGHSPYRRPERPTHQNRMPRYVPPRPRSVLRPHAGSSQIRRTIYRPQPPNRPRTPPEYMKRVPHNQYDWRTTPTRSVHRMAPISTNEYKPRIPTKSPGLKITNKTWMRKPVYHLGFACGPEKEKIMMQY